MKQLFLARNRKLQIFGILILAFIGVLMFLTDGFAAGHVGTFFAACPIVPLIAVAPVAISAEESAFIEKVKNEVTSEIEKHKKDYISETKLNEILNAKFADYSKNMANTEQITELKKAFEDLGVRFNQQIKGNEKEMGFFEQLKNLFSEKKEEIKESVNGKNVKLSLKTDATPITTGNFGAGVIRGYRESGVAGTLPNELDALTVIMTMNGGKDSNPLSWIERAVLNGGAATVVEGNEKPYMDVEWTENKVTSETIAVITPISKKAVNNYSLLESEVRNELLIDLRNELNRQVINGSGITGTEIKGILGTYATAFNAGGKTVTNPNDWDVLTLAWKQSRKKYKGSRPNAILVPIGYTAEMDLTKNLDGTYVIPAWMLAQDRTLKGARIIESDDIAAGTYLIGNFNDYLLNFVENIIIEIGLINDQFRRNQFSIRAELECMGRVKSNRNSFVKGVFADDIEEITPAAS